MDIMATDEKAGLYHPLVPGAMQPLHLAIHVSGDPRSFTPRLRSIASDIDATAVITSTTPLGDVLEGDWYIGGSVVLGGIVLVCILLTLAASAIYAMMSFAVAQRAREIGIRSALGAQPAAIVFTITRRALAQLGLGLLIGLPIAGFLYTALRGDVWTFSSLVIGLAPGVAAVALIGLFACTAPTLRALRITPTEALRGD
jgi:ABC-type antimicrobial peptide transport system permease subunit